MRLHLVAVGRVRNAALSEACDEYVRRVGRYQRIDLREVKEAGRRARSGVDACRMESDALVAAVPADAQLVALSRVGTALDSVGLANLLGRWREAGRDVAFVIGGAFGLSDTLVGRAQYVLSLSAMTFPHELARLVLLEQLYRACTILKGEPYHKGPAPA